MKIDETTMGSSNFGISVDGVSGSPSALNHRAMKLLFYSMTLLIIPSRQRQLASSGKLNDTQGHKKGIYM